MIYLVATPIGNLKDITLRALEILEEVDLIACEDTRVTKILLDHYDIKNKLVSYHKFNENEKSDYLIEQALEGKNIAVVSDAGMPGISDPGNIIVKKAIENGIKYTAIPGANAFSTALILSGFDTDSFVFHGFLSNKGSERNRKLKEIQTEKKVQILYESPHKLDKTMQDFLSLIPNRKIAIIREISKMFESVSIFNVKDYFEKDIIKKGEIVLIIDKDDENIEINDDYILQKLIEELDNGQSKKNAVKIVSKMLDVNKNRVYEISLKM